MAALNLRLKREIRGWEELWMEARAWADDLESVQMIAFRILLFKMWKRAVVIPICSAE